MYYIFYVQEGLLDFVTATDRQGACDLLYDGLLDVLALFIITPTNSIIHKTSSWDEIQTPRQLEILTEFVKFAIENTEPLVYSVSNGSVRMI